MLYVSTLTYYDVNNDFRLKEILVSDGEVTYSLSPDSGYSVSLPYHVSLEKIAESDGDNVTYPILGFSKIRYYNDDDAKSLASYLSKKFSGLGDTSPRQEKFIYDLLSGFGDADAGH